MAWNTSPEIAELREFAKKHKCMVVITMFITDDGRLGYHSYGNTKAMCGKARKIADDLYEAMEESASNHLEWEYVDRPAHKE